MTHATRTALVASLALSADAFLTPGPVSLGPRLQRPEAVTVRDYRFRTGVIQLKASGAMGQRPDPQKMYVGYDPSNPDVKWAQTVGQSGSGIQIPQMSKLVKNGDTPMLGCVNNLVKNIVGSGVLCLAGAIAAFSDNPAMLLPAMGIAGFFAVIAAYCFVLIARTCEMTGAQSYSDAWAKTIGQETAWIPTLIVVFKTWSACLIYSIIIADLTVDLCATAGIKSVGSLVLSRTNIILISHVFGLLPLCLLRSFTMLSYFAGLGIAAVLFVAGFMSLRLLEGSYAPGGFFFASIMKAEGKRHVITSFNVAGTQLIKGLVLVSTLTSSYLCHYNAPKFLKELRNATTGRFQQLTYSSFSLAFILNAVFMVTGFLTFGGMSKGLILNNYATSDVLATASRGAIAASILLGYPITFEGFRGAFLELIKNKAPTQQVKDLIAVGFLFACGGSAMLLRDLGAVVSFFGALLGSMVIYTIPALMYRKARGMEIAASGEVRPFGYKWPVGVDYYLSGGLVPFGAVLALLGATVVVLKACTNVLK